jgi:hypothetical protein
MPPGAPHIRASITKQLELPLPRLLSLREHHETLAEERDRVALGERCLWGASVVMSSIGMTQRHRPLEMPYADVLEAQWWKLYDLLEAIRADWPADEREKWDADRLERRKATWNEVVQKMAAAGMPWQGAPYAVEEQGVHDTKPIIRFDIDARYAREKGRLEVRDPFTGEWHDIAYRDAPHSWRDMARAHAETRR